jgi:hypothetical protein
MARKVGGLIPPCFPPKRQPDCAELYGMGTASSTEMIVCRFAQRSYRAKAGPSLYVQNYCVGERSEIREKGRGLCLHWGCFWPAHCVGMECGSVARWKSIARQTDFTHVFSGRNGILLLSVWKFRVVLLRQRRCLSVDLAAREN